MEVINYLKSVNLHVSELKFADSAKLQVIDYFLLTSSAGDPECALEWD